MRSIRPLQATERVPRVLPEEQRVSRPVEPQPAGLEEPEERLLAQVPVAQLEQQELRTAVLALEPEQPAVLMEQALQVQLMGRVGYPILA